MAYRLARLVGRRSMATTRTILSSKTLVQLPSLLSYLQEDQKKLSFPSPQPYSGGRTYITEMRKSAFEGNILRLIRNEIQYELEHSPPSQPVPEFYSFTVDERPGEQWIRLNRKFGENEEIKVEVTMFDGSLPVKKTGCIVTDDDVDLHITMIVDIFKGDNSSVLEFVCSAWPKSIEIQKVFIRGHDQMAGHPYMGPEFKELDDGLQDSLYEYLETRGINDELAVFLHEYMKNKDKCEFIRWMENVKSFINRK